MTTFPAEPRYNRNTLLLLALAAISFSLPSAARGRSVGHRVRELWSSG